MVVEGLQTGCVFGLPCCQLIDADDIAQVRQRRIRSQLGTGRAFPRIDDILCSDRFSIMELCAFTQVKRVHHAVSADLPGFGQIGCQVQLRIEGDQPAVEQFVSGAVGGGGVVVAGIRGLAAGQDEGLVQGNVCLVGSRRVNRGEKHKEN